MHVHTQIYTCVCTHMHVTTQTHTRAHTMHVYTHARTHMYTCAHAHTHTHTLTGTQHIQQSEVYNPSFLPPYPLWSLICCLTLNNLSDILHFYVLLRTTTKMVQKLVSICLTEIGFKVVNAIPKQFQNIVPNIIFKVVLIIKQIQCHSKLINLILSYYHTLASFLIGIILL